MLAAGLLAKKAVERGLKVGAGHANACCMGMSMSSHYNLRAPATEIMLG